MYKVLIADDEHRICSLISRLIDWQGLGLEPAGIANDGEAAYLLIKELKPDIVIADIKMPRLSGIDLIKRMWEENNNCKFIIYSGHKQFDYARNAFKYNAVDYLLKPVNKEELNTALQKICNMLAAERDEAEQLNDLKHKYEDNRRKLREMFLVSCIKGTNTHSLEICRAEFRLGFGDGFYNAFILALDDYAATQEMNRHKNILSRIEAIFCDSLAHRFDEFVSVIIDNEIVALAYAEQVENTMLNKWEQAAFLDVHQYITAFSGLSITMGTGSMQKGYPHLPLALETARQAVQSRILWGRNKIILHSKLHYRHTPPERLMSKTAKLKLVRSFEILDSDSFISWLNDLFAEFGADYHPSMLFDLCDEISDVFNDMIEKILPDVSFAGGPLRQDMLGRVNNAGGIHEVQRAIRISVVTRLNYIAEQKSILDLAPVREAKQYIADHYMEQIKLEDIARKVYLHPAYLSTVFKKSTGMNFIDYLTGYRIEKAKELLSTTNDRVSDIAKSVGYIEPHSFSKRFTTLVGIKPTEYRRLHS